LTKSKSYDNINIGKSSCGLANPPLAAFNPFRCDPNPFILYSECRLMLAFFLPWRKWFYRKR